jgi:hypothetical protein
VLIHRILTMNWRNKLRARPRRSAAKSRFQLETLEDRTALSVAWGAPPPAPLLHPAADVRLDAIRAVPVLNLDSTALAIDQAALPVAAPSAPFDPSNVSSLPNTEYTARGSGVIESPLAGALSMAGGGATIASLVVSGGDVVPKSSALRPALDSMGTFAGSSASQPTDVSGRAMSLEDLMASFDPRAGDSQFPMGPPFGPDDPFGLALLSRGFSPANPNENQTDMSLSGPLLWIETDTALLTWMSLTQATGRSSGRGSSQIFADLALQMNPTGEVGGSSGLLYLATGGWTSLLDEISAMREDEILLVDRGPTESETTASVLDTGIPLSILLWGTDAPIPNEQGGVEQVAELIPLSESSLALAATLWTVRSDSQASAPGSELAAGADADPVISSLSPQYWAVFMTGVDRAFEQTFRDVQVDTFASDGRHRKSEEAQRGLDDRLQWQRPILPGAADELRGGKQRSTRPGHGSSDNDARTRGRPAVSHRTGDEQGEETSQAPRVAQPQDSEVQPVVLASTPVLWVVSISSIVAGWFWGKKRERRQRSGLGASHSRSR